LSDDDARRLTGKIFGDLRQRYMDRHKIIATPDEIQQFVDAMRRLSPTNDDASEARKKDDRRGDEAIGEQLVKGWKLDRMPYKEYGGTVIFQQGNPFEPVGAYRGFLEEMEKAKVFEIYDPDNRQKFWHYFVRQHPFQVPAKNINFDNPCGCRRGDALPGWLRQYGRPPFAVAVLHGGPGAPGYMAPVARELSAEWGVVEPLQAADSLQRQVEELRAILVDNASLPVVLVGSSWGAMLGFILSARHPELVQKLVMVGCPVFEARYAAQMQAIRFSRLAEDEAGEARSLMEVLGDPVSKDKTRAFARLGVLFTKADAYDPLTLEIEVLEHQYDVYRRVWGDASELRRSGGFSDLGKQIRCPVVAIHGDHDPHLAEGVEGPLTSNVKNSRFILLRNCGHLPWIERQAKDRFYSILRAELRSSRNHNEQH